MVMETHLVPPTPKPTSKVKVKGKGKAKAPLYLSTKEKYLGLQRKFEELAARQKKNKALLENASLKLKSLQSECDMLIDSIIPRVSTQPSLLHFLERTSREDASWENKEVDIITANGCH